LLCLFGGRERGGALFVSASPAPFFAALAPEHCYRALTMTEPMWIAAAAAFVAGAVLSFIIARVTAKKPESLPPPSPQLPAAPPQPTQAAQQAPALFMLSMLQREGRLIDFLQEDIAGYSDEQVGAAARVVHEGCRKVVRQYLSLEPVLNDSEGASVQVPAGFDAQRIRLTGNVAGAPPFKGSLKHHGWAAREVSLPPPPEAMDPKILAPAEVELP
jgi:hypothetical protein